MPSIGDEGKAYRVQLWLEDLSACRRKLEGAEQSIAEITELSDGIRGRRLDVTPNRYAKPDKIGAMVADREEALEALESHAAELRGAVRTGMAAIADAWGANRGTADASFRYVIARYACGCTHERAARAAGLGRYAAKLAPRKVAPMIYDAHPELFARIGGESDYYGYDEAMRI